MKYSYDEKCGELAFYFLEGSPRKDEQPVQELAQAIQDCIEAWIAAHPVRP